jgi:U3 small nucleolar RNA-associated protein 21
MFNLQSGIHRQRFPRPTKPTMSSKVKERQVQTWDTTSIHYQANGQINTEKHAKAVTGLAVDSLNRNVVSCGLDGRVKVQLLAFNREAR